MSEYRIFKGTVLHCIEQRHLEIFADGALVINKAGKIVEVGPQSLAKKYPNAETTDTQGKLIVPGFVDTHVHLPQYIFAGLGANELLPWLEEYTFPTETLFADKSFAAQAAQKFFFDLTRLGTTTAAVYPTVHKNATEEAFRAAAQSGARVIMGKILMDRNAPPALLQPVSQLLSDSEELAEKWHGYDNGRLFYAVTPRFAITCSEECLRGAARLAHQKDLYIQTHLAENPSEVAWIKELFPHSKSYTDVYNGLGLLTEKSLYAHCIYLSNDDRELFQKTGASAVHCATSNRYLQSGVFPMRLMERAGVSVCLGSDVAGGYSLSMLNEMREALETSKVWNIINRETMEPVLSVGEVFYYVTLGGAKALRLDSKIGNFLPGKEADFVILDDAAINRFPDISLFQKPEDRLARLIYRGESSTVRDVFVRGARIAGNAPVDFYRLAPDSNFSRNENSVDATISKINGEILREKGV